MNQGHYLTEAPAELVRFLDRAYRAKSGQDLPYVRLMSDESPGTRNKGQLEITSLIDGIAGQGFVFEPWQVAAYATALRTKPFVILAGVSGTGKSKLPRLVSEATGGESTLIPVRPDWTDSSDILGYCSLDGKFRPGRFLEFVREATDHPDKHFVCIIDEMNLARVEHYFAEILSRIEDRHPAEQGGYESDPILGISLSDEDGAVWNTLKLPANLAIVGTVNMDESTLGFSRKVLDRAFTIELSDVDLPNWGLGAEPRIAELGWPVENWYPRAIRLSGLATRSEAERTIINEVIEALSELNAILVQAQLQVGYRTRDEVVLFVLHAQDVRSSFVTHQGEPVDPLDLALHMKILPRLAGGSSPLKHAIARLLGWAYDGSAAKGEADITNLVETWGSTGCPSRLAGARYPLTAARLCLMLGRLRDEGFTSFWL